MPQDHVAGGLVIDFVTEPLKRPHRVAARAGRKPAHGETSTNSSVIGGGIGSPCFFRLARYPEIASLMFSMASTRVLPCDTHPGNDGHSATNTPSSSTSMVTR